MSLNIHHVDFRRSTSMTTIYIDNNAIIAGQENEGTDFQT